MYLGVHVPEGMAILCFACVCLYVRACMCV